MILGIRALTSNRPTVGWLLIAAGQACWAIGNFYYAIVLWWTDPMPFPTAADAVWIVFYTVTLAGIVMLHPGPHCQSHRNGLACSTLQSALSR